MASFPNTTPQLLIKHPAKAFDISDSASSIRFLHPGYRDDDNLLLILPAFDGGGVHHETARIACAILADCRWDGYFSETPNGPRLNNADVDTILTGSSYYFCINTNSPEPYPVIPSFDHFRCPPDLPPSWLSIPIEPSASERVPERDQTCRITNWALPLEIAHIVPAAQADWWRRNNMALYARRPEASSETDCSENAILLRKDVHALWNRHRFCLVPKGGQWVIHVLDNPTSRELQDTYHNLSLQPLKQVSHHYLLARLALAILSEKSMFIRLGIMRRRLVLVDDENKKSATFLTSQECRNRFGPSSLSKSRSHSPRKRPRTAASADIDECSGDSDLWQVESRRIWIEEQWGENFQKRGHEDPGSSDEEQRGRPRKRRWRSPASITANRHMVV